MIKTRGIDDPNTLPPLRLQFQIQTKAFVGTKHGAAETQKKAPAKLHTDEMRTSVHQKELNLHESPNRPTNAIILHTAVHPSPMLVCLGELLDKITLTCDSFFGLQRHWSH